MSHEIRTPMNAIVGMTEVALREEMTPGMRKCLKTVQSSAFGLLTLINDILDYSKIDVIAINAGSNDWTGNTEFGNKDSTNVNTFCGAINSIVNDILSAGT